MRKLLLIFIFFTFHFVQAQTYYPIPTDPSYKWHHWETNNLGGTQQDYYNTFYNEHDTFIRGKTYHVTPSIISLDLVWREENKQVFATRLNTSDTSEIMLYDFNLSVGDTFYIPPSAFGICDKWVIDSVSYTLVDGTLRRTLWPVIAQTGAYPNGCGGQYLPVTPFFLNNTPGGRYRWIEGVGSNRHFYNFLVAGPLLSEGFDNWLTCFTRNDTTLYVNQILYLQPFDYQCDITMNLTTPNSKHKLFYNPENQQIESDVFGKIEVFNLSGQLLISENTKTLDVSHLPNSLYFCKITTNNSFQTLKFLKQ